MRDIEIEKLYLDNVVNGPLAKRTYTVLLKWAKFVGQYYSDWDKRPNTGHFFGGSYNYAQESAYCLAVYAVLASIGDYDEKITTISRKDMKDMAIKTLRYLCFTHDTGPKDCVRGKSPNPRCNNQKWGGKDDHFFMASQTGRSISMMGMAAWFLWKDIDYETKEMIEAVIISYAERFCEMDPKNGVYNDTQCEENAWTAGGLAIAFALFPNHARAKIWKKGYVKWSLNSVTTYLDKFKFYEDKIGKNFIGSFVEDNESYGVSSITFHPDFTTENHGFIHPDYMQAGILLRMIDMILSAMGNKETCKSTFYNAKIMYDKTIKPWCMEDGVSVAVQGQDWYYHKQYSSLVPHTIMNVKFSDPIAARFELNALDIIEKRQCGNENGCFLESNGNELVITPNRQTAMDMEYYCGRYLLLSYLTHAFYGEGVKAVSTEQAIKSLEGAYSYPYGNINIYRTRDTFSCFSTRCSIMGLSLPKKGVWTITPSFNSFTGIINTSATKKSLKESFMMHRKDMALYSYESNVYERDNGFSSITRFPRANEELEQVASFTALEDGKCVYIEKLICKENTVIEDLMTGFIGVGNEGYELLKDLNNGKRNIYINDNINTFKGYYKDEESNILDKEDFQYVNIDNEMGYIVRASRGLRYINQHKYPKWKGKEDFLILNYDEKIRVKKNQELEALIVVSVPNATNIETKALNEIMTSNIKDDCYAIDLKDSRVIANFNKKVELIEYSSNILNNCIPLYSGEIAIKKNKVTYKKSCLSFSSHFETCNYILKSNSDNLDIKILVAKEQQILINKQNKEIHFKILNKKKNILKEITLKANMMIELALDFNY